MQYTQYEAVALACHELGTSASVSETQKRAEAHYEGKIPYQSVVVHRCAFRKTPEGKAIIKKNKVGTDARTYAGQPRRDMRRDDRLEIPHLKRLSNFLKKCKREWLIALIGEGEHRFHSAEQLLDALQDLDALQVA